MMTFFVPQEAGIRYYLGIFFPTKHIFAKDILQHQEFHFATSTVVMDEYR